MTPEVWKNAWTGTWNVRGEAAGKVFTVASFSKTLLEWKYRHRSRKVSAQVATAKRIEERLGGVRL